MLDYVAHTLLLWSCVVFETCPTRTSDTFCVFLRIYRVFACMSLSVWPYPCNIGARFDPFFISTQKKILKEKERSLFQSMPHEHYPFIHIESRITFKHVLLISHINIISGAYQLLQIYLVLNLLFVLFVGLH